MKFISIFCVLLVILIIGPAQAADTCTGNDHACLFNLLDQTSSAIAEDHWRDSTYRETAKLLTHAGNLDAALATINKISDADTKAMAIRGIGMAAAEGNWPIEEYADLFRKLHEKAAAIDHPPSHAIALTYIAMAQAKARDDQGAMKTAQQMENPALRNKAHAEAAEIQAERGDLSAALSSIEQIKDPAFVDKALRTVSKILVENNQHDEALKAADKIENSYQKAQAILYILVQQLTPEEVSIQ